jgi:hypothetical protein
MALDIVTWGLSRRTYLVYRGVVVAVLLTLGILATLLVLRDSSIAGRIDIGEGVLDRFSGLVVRLHASPVGYAAAAFRPFVEVIVAESMAAAATWAAVAVGIVLMLSGAVVWLYGVFCQRVSQREKTAYRPAAVSHMARAETLASWRRLRTMPRLWGAGPLAWRQLLGARRHWGSLLTAMLVPAALACAPCFVLEDPYIAYLSTGGALAFYSFLLLPTALRFDFRRDLDRLATLKTLPVTPAACALGQTLAPVLITTVFQCGVLAFAIAARSLPAHLLPVTLLIFVPLNAFVFGLDSLIFLLYPYRPQQEGLEIFLRTMLTFTGKGLLFAVGLGAMSLWGFGAAAVSRGASHSLGIGVNPFAVFAGGMVVGMATLAGLVLLGVSRTYARLDPIEDVPR